MLSSDGSGSRPPSPMSVPRQAAARLERLWALSDKLLSQRPQSTHELRLKLGRVCHRWERKAVSAEHDTEESLSCDDLVDAVIRRLAESRRVDDDAFAVWLVEQRASHTPRPQWFVCRFSVGPFCLMRVAVAGGFRRNSAFVTASHRSRLIGRFALVESRAIGTLVFEKLIASVEQGSLSSS